MLQGHQLTLWRLMSYPQSIEHKVNTARTTLGNKASSYRFDQADRPNEQVVLHPCALQVPSASQAQWQAFWSNRGSR